jgi:hypothetical protein
MKTENITQTQAKAENYRKREKKSKIPPSS